MTTRYSFSSYNPSGMMDRERTHDKFSTSALRPCTPPLDRAPTPNSMSSPPTPTYQSASPIVPRSLPKQQFARQVDFSKPMSSSRKVPGAEEKSVMRAFASHASHCETCNDPLLAFAKNSSLCVRGVNYAKDLCNYFYLVNARPYSKTEYMKGREGVEVDIPVEYAVVKQLFKALDQGFKVDLGSQSKPEVHQTTQANSASTLPLRRYTDQPSSTTTRYVLDEGAYELRPAQTKSRRQTGAVYKSPTGRSIETRSPYDAIYSESPVDATPRTKFDYQSPEQQPTSSPSKPTSSRKVQVHSDSENQPQKKTSRSTRRSSSWDKEDRKRGSRDRSTSTTQRFYGYELEPRTEPRKARRESTYIPFASGLFGLTK